MVLHIARLEIKNYRNFQHLLIGPFPARAVVVGENGTGKSNLLRALRLVLDPSLPDTARMLDADDVWSGASSLLPTGVEVSVEIELAGFDEDDGSTAVLDRCLVAAAPARARITYVWKPKEYSPGSILEVGDYTWQIYGAGDETNDVSRVRRDIALRVLDALRDAENDLQNWRRNPIREMLTRITLAPGVDAKISKGLDDAVAALAADGSIIALEEVLRNRLKAMAGVALPIDPTLGFLAGDSEELLRGVHLFIDRARKWGVTRASLGGSNVLYLALLLEQFSQRREAEEYAAYVLAVEEPEAHLHVTLQRKLFRWLLRHEESLILTTHSPHIAAVAPLSSLVRLQIEGPGTVGRIPPLDQLTTVQIADLERYLDVSRAEILFARAVILVEGAAEQYLIPTIAEILNIDLDEWGIVIASVQGTDFVPYVRLLGPAGIGTPLAVVTDGDRVPGERGVPGLNRGINLAQIIDPTGAPSFPQDYVDDAPSEIRNTLGAHGIFVGDRTLELDIRTSFGSEMVSAFSHFNEGLRVQESFSTELYALSEDVSDLRLQARLLGRIEKIGKGRYAQRLSGSIDAKLFDSLRTQPAPVGIQYLVEAIRHVHTILGGGE